MADEAAATQLEGMNAGAVIDTIPYYTIPYYMIYHTILFVDVRMNRARLPVWFRQEPRKPQSVQESHRGKHGRTDKEDTKKREKRWNQQRRYYREDPEDDCRDSAS